MRQENRDKEHDPRPKSERGLVSIPENAFAKERMEHSASAPKCVDLFAGAGGFGLGMSLAGWNVQRAIERDAWACDTLKANHPNCDVVKADITQLNDAALATAVCHAELIIGGPPCQGFSVASNTAGDPFDPRNSLFREFVRAVSLAKPKFFIMENVPGLLRRKTATGDPVIDIIISSFDKIGYHTHSTVLKGCDFGVPQLRPRLFVIGSTSPIQTWLPEPTHSNTHGAISLFKERRMSRAHTLLIDAIDDLPTAGPPGMDELIRYSTDPKCPLQRLLRADASGVYNHHAMRHSPRLVARFHALKWGESGGDAPTEHRARKRGSANELSGKDYDQNNRRLHPFRVSHTIPASFYANFVHPYFDRNFTPREGARIQTFPDWYIFKGKPTVVSQKLLQREGRDTELHLCQYNQIGNAVPPLLAYALGRHLMEQTRNEQGQIKANAV